MTLTGIADEAGAHVDAQIRATQELGWNHIEARFVEVDGFEKGSIHEIPDAAFDEAAAALADAGVQVCGVGSTIGNWAHAIDDPFDITEGEVARCIDRMGKLGCQLVRIMSYAILEDGKENDLPDQQADERFRRVAEIVRRFEDAGITPVHENCMNYGGMSIEHALRLQDAVPGLKWVFDTGNPVFNADRSQPRPYPRQDAWDFYQAVKPHIAHIHIKDGIWDAEKGDCTYTMPGEGEGQVARILADLKADGYAGFVSIEPHLAAVFHEEDRADTDPEAKARAQYETYVAYGRTLSKLIETLP